MLDVCFSQRNFPYMSNFSRREENRGAEEGVVALHWDSQHQRQPCAQKMQRIEHNQHCAQHANQHTTHTANAHEHTDRYNTRMITQLPPELFENVMGFLRAFEDIAALANTSKVGSLPELEHPLCTHARLATTPDSDFLSVKLNTAHERAA